MAAAPRRLEAGLRAGGGWDGDALQGGLAGGPDLPRAALPAAPSGFVEVAAGATRRLADDGPAADLAYGFSQLAYGAAAAEDRSLQQHVLALSADVAAARALRLGAALEGQLALTGLSRFRAMRGAAGVRGWAALDLGGAGTLRLDLGWTHKEGLRDEFAYLTGERLDAGLWDTLRLGPVTVQGGVRAAVDAIGTVRAADASGALVVNPLGTWGVGPWLSARAALGRRFTVALGGGVEWRSRLEDAFVEVPLPGGGAAQVGRQRLDETRWQADTALGFEVSPRVSLFLRGDLLLIRSGADTSAGFGGGPRCFPGAPSCAVRDGSGQGYERGVVTVGTTLSW